MSDEKDTRTIQERCDDILQNSWIQLKGFEATDSELEGNVCKYFDDRGNCVKVDAVKRELTLIPWDQIT